MKYIDEKFKDSNPKDTVNRLKDILSKLGIETREEWNDSGIENCYSLHLCDVKGLPGTNGKGISADFARASAYAELLERIQSGLYLISYQSIHRDPEMNLHTYAPDGKYMTITELIENGEWMDPIIESYTDMNLTREMIAEHCRAYACADNGQILTIPFYSLFEDKYVYIPVSFAGRMYTANGSCAGNTREEAWVHALSEIMERYASQKVLKSGMSAPRIPDEVLEQFSAVSNILRQLREKGQFDITVFDYSIGNGFPIVSSRIINKKEQSYHINVAADPVLEIAVQRTLTELFQGRSVDHLKTRHAGIILNKITDFPIVSNVQNQLQTSDGVYTADYFADELTCDKKCAQFPDNSNKSNKELLKYMLDLYRQLGKPVYVRNYSYLGFHSYKFIVPGFSETKAPLLNERIPEYSLGDSVRDIFRNPAAASNEDLIWMLRYSDTTKLLYGQYNTYSVNAGLPMTGVPKSTLCAIIRAYACYRLKNYEKAIRYLNTIAKIPILSQEDKDYFTCINKYLEMKKNDIAEEKIRVILYKFFTKDTADKLYDKLDRGQTPYDDHLPYCDTTGCQDCRYRENCCYQELKELTRKVGAVYSTFIHGQDRAEFTV